MPATLLEKLLIEKEPITGGEIYIYEIAAQDSIKASFDCVLW